MNAQLPAIQVSDPFEDAASFEHFQRVAKVFASSNLVPQHFRGNVADCLIALQIARRIGEEPLTAMQSMFIINGRPGWATAYMIARANRSGTFKGPITWKSEGAGEALAVTAMAVLAVTGEVITVTCDMRMAKAEGWTKNAKYTSMPEHMLRWRSAAMLIRLYCPEVMLGMPVLEEIETAAPEMRDVTPGRTVNEALDAFADAAEGAAPAAAPDAAAAHHGAPSPAPSSGEATADTPQTASQQVAQPEPTRPAADTEAAPAQSAPAALPASGTPAPAGAAEAPWPDGKVPKTEAEYVQFARAWIAKVESGKISPSDAALQWKADMKVRSACTVTEDTRDSLRAELDKIVAAVKVEAA